MQIAGSKCVVCGKGIVLSREGMFCPGCLTAVHITCVPGARCVACGQDLQREAAPKIDPLEDAILPRALRPASSSGPAFAIAFGVGFATLIIFIWFAIHYALSHGH